MRDAQDADVLASGVSSPGPSSGSPSDTWTRTGAENLTSGSSVARLIRAAIVAALVVVVDQVTKWMALNALEPGPCSEPDACIDLVLGIKFNLVFNTGAAFTSGSGYGPVFGVLAFFMTGFLLYLASQRQDRWGLLGFAAIAGGAAGNLLDRIFRADDGFLSGAVIDFIDFGWWPVFNIADSAIVLGVIGILIMTAFEKPAESPGSDDAVSADPLSDDSVPDDPLSDDVVLDDALSDDADNSTSDGERAPETETGEDPGGGAAIVESGD